MALAKFGPGQDVTLARPQLFQAAGPYMIVGIVPPGAGPTQYRVRSDVEAFDRIVDESALEASILP